MKTTKNLNVWLAMAMLLLLMVSTAAGGTIYVDDDGPADFNNIQAAIDDSNEGDTIIVQPGLYLEFVKFGGKNITLTSTNTVDSNVVASTIIDYGVGFAGTEDPNCTLKGFKINGRIWGVDYGIDPTGENHTHATISCCLLVDCHRVSDGMVIEACDGTISNCVIVDNWPDGDAVSTAIVGCHGLIKNCTIAHNFSGIFVLGGGTTTIENCIIYDNRSVQVGVGTGGTVKIRYSDVEGGVEGIISSGTVNWGPGNIDTDPCFVRLGRREYYEPNWVFFEGDYHLLPDSPCIDAGDPNYIAEPNETDLDGKPRVMGGRIDMGAYEYQGPQILYVDADATGANDGSSWADAYNYLQDALADANSGDEIRVAEGIYKPDQGGGITPGSRTATFQLKNGVTIRGGYAGLGEPEPNARDIDAYEAVLSGDLAGNDVEVADPRDLLEHPSRDENSYHVVTGSGTDETAVLDGFTITCGSAKYRSRLERFNADNAILIPPPIYGPENWGGGLYNSRGSPTVSSCTFTKNTAYSGGAIYNRYNSSPMLTQCTFSENIAKYGGGMYNSQDNSILTNCTFNGNVATGSGGGIFSFGPILTLTDCLLTENSAGWSGGAICNGYGNLKMTNCTLRGNCANYNGGGMLSDHSSVTLTNCTFSGNCSADAGGGMYNYRSDLTLTNCIFSGNSGEGNGGGIYCRNNSLTRVINCTFAVNSALNGTSLACDSYGSEYPSSVQVTNSIFWDGGNEIWNNDGSTIMITYSDIQGGWPSEGNIDIDPSFVSPGYWDANDTPDDTNDDFWIEGDYHLLPDSPCIDAGDPNYVAEPNETDLDGKPRIIGSRIDMGAYEYNPPIPAEARIVPRTINLASKGKWISCYIWLPEEYDVADIDPNSILLEDEIQADWFLVDEQEQAALARFSREQAQAILEAGQAELTISGQLTDGTVFEATDIIKVIDKRGGKSAK